MNKKVIAIILVVVFCFNLAVFCSASEAPLPASSIKEDILNRFAEETVRAKYSGKSKTEIDSLILASQTNAVRALRSAGFDAYAVNAETFSAVEAELQTDLRSIGLSPDYKYIIVVEGDPNEQPPDRATFGPNFQYTYNGITYIMRYMTISGSDDPLMTKASASRVLNSSSQSDIQACLSAAVSAYISSISNALGLVTTICGLLLSDFSFNYASYMDLHGETKWFRQYSQVYSTYDQAWFNGASVEYVIANAFMSGRYYDANTNNFSDVPENSSYTTTYSAQYTNTSWRKEYGVRGYLNSYTYNDVVGNVYYYYNGVTKITHIENF